MKELFKNPVTYFVVVVTLLAIAGLYYFIMVVPQRSTKPLSSNQLNVSGIENPPMTMTPEEADKLEKEGLSASITYQEHEDCLQKAYETLRAKWAEEAKALGKAEDSTTLPKNIADKLNAEYKSATEDCNKKYPQE